MTNLTYSRRPPQITSQPHLSSAQLELPHSRPQSGVPSSESFVSFSPLPITPHTRNPPKPSLSRTPKPHARSCGAHTSSEAVRIASGWRQKARWKWRSFWVRRQLRDGRACAACRPRRGSKTRGPIRHVAFRVVVCHIRELTKLGRSLHVWSTGSDVIG